MKLSKFGFERLKKSRNNIRNCKIENFKCPFQVRGWFCSSPSPLKFSDSAYFSANFPSVGNSTLQRTEQQCSDAERLLLFSYNCNDASDLALGEIKIFFVWQRATGSGCFCSRVRPLRLLLLTPSVWSIIVIVIVINSLVCMRPIHWRTRVQMFEVRNQV